MEGSEAAHRQANDMRPLDASRSDDGSDVVGGVVLGVGRTFLGNIRRWVAPCAVGHAPVPPGEEPDLRFPAPVVASELVDENDREARSGLLVVQPDTVVVRVGHASIRLSRIRAVSSGG